jgi:2-phosphoglycerate kinase
MAGKPSVIERGTGRQIPFLRGILVQSLVAAGLSFNDAYDLARRVREVLDKHGEPLDTASLRGLVGEQLERRFGEGTRLLYDAGSQQERAILVRKGRRDEAFSVGVLTRHLEGCGIRHEEASRGARLVQVYLRDRDETVIERGDLRRIIFDTLKSECCSEAADRFLSRSRFNDSREPLIVLIGGATGAGKSTIAARLAYLLDVVRMQSTDIMREIIRCYLVPHVAPTLGFSSFDAWKGLPEVEPLVGAPLPENPVVAGFLAQFGTVRVALEATIQRAVKEQQDLIVDGVHVLPSRLDLAGIQGKAVVVPLVLAVTTRGKLDDHLLRRSREQPDRDSERHRSTLDSIWLLQDFMVDQAEKAGIPVIANWDIEETLERTMDEAIERIAERYPPDPASLGWTST